VAVKCDDHNGGVGLMLCKWTRSCKGLLSGNIVVWNGDCFHFVVERLPGRGWDWTVWHADRPQESVRHGNARSAKAGVEATEDAVARLVGIPSLARPRYSYSRGMVTPISER